MRRIFKKFITVLLIVLILFNFTILEPVSFAADALELVTNIMGTFVGILTWLFRLPAIGIALAANVLTAQIAYMDGATAGNTAALTITPFEIFANKVQLFDVNFFDFESLPESSATYKIRMSVAQWFYIMRLIAVSALLVILVYVGIRMAITTIAEDKARYKQMLIDWITSLAIVFLLQFIIIFTVNVNSALVNAIMNPFGGNDDVNNVISDLAVKGLGVSVEALGATVVYCMIVWQTFGFVLAYLNRTIKIAFLIIISPLISITYAIDKMGDGKSQALNAWLKEFIYTILMQPFHCVIYITLVNVAFDLLVDGAQTGEGVAEAVIAILCIKFVKTAEDIVRRIFNFEDDNKGTSLAAGTAVAAAALSKSKDIGKTARKGINFVKESKLSESIKQDGVKLRAAVSAMKLTKDEKENKKNGGHVSSYSARVKSREAAIQDKQDKKKRQKEEAKTQRFYEKHKDKFTAQDSAQISKNAKKIQEEYNNNEENKKAGRTMSNTEALRQARLKISREKISSGAYKNRVIRGAKQISKTVGNLNTVKYLKNTVIPAGFGMGVAFMSYGGDANAINAAMTGMAFGKSGMEFMKNSTATLAGDMAGHLMAQGKFSKEDIEKAVQGIKMDGDSGAFDESSMNKLLEEIKQKIGNPTTFSTLKTEIDSMLNRGELDFNMNEVLNNSKIDTSKMDSKQIESWIEALEQYKTFKHNQAIYQSISNGAQVGISVETLIEKASSEIEVEYSEATFLRAASTTQLSKDAIKSISHRQSNKKTDYNFKEIRKSLDEEIEKVDNQINELKGRMPTMNSIERSSAELNVKKLENSKKMLSGNISTLEDLVKEEL